MAEITTSIEFQFLIGRLKTMLTLKNAEEESMVSIPHRQAKNFFYKITILQFLPVSIPHRQAKNFSREKSEGEEKHVSIPHRQAKNSKSIKQAICGQDGVSIPHRQAKNPLARTPKTMQFVFQFLIGRLKTVEALPNIALSGSFNSSQVG